MLAKLENAKNSFAIDSHPRSFPQIFGVICEGRVENPKRPDSLQLTISTAVHGPLLSN